jgi:thiol-disulfide isomerase/thioredoxin
MKKPDTFPHVLLSVLMWLALSLPLQLPAQDGPALTFKVRGGENRQFFLYNYYADRKYIIDSVRADGSGQVVFCGIKVRVPGMYRIQSGKDRGLDFLLDGREDVFIQAEAGFAIDSVCVVRSEENKVLVGYLQHNRHYRERMELLVPLLMHYPRNDTFFADIEQHARALEGEFRAYLDAALTGPAVLAPRVIRLDQLERVEPEALGAQRREHLKGNYFETVDLTDTFLLRTPLLPGKLVSYLTLFVIPGAQRDKQELSFMAAVDSLMKFTSGQPEVQNAVANYLVEGFQAYGFEGVMQHIVEHYMLGNSCVSEAEESKLKLRVEGFKKMAVGNRAPDFEAFAADGSLVRLSGCPEGLRLLFFWSSECPHCKSAIPVLRELAKEYQGKLAVIGISVDASEDAWRRALAENEMGWNNIAELAGWDGKIIRDYYIYATPTFFLVDKDMRIMAKPMGISELGVALSGLK